MIEVNLLPKKAIKKKQSFSSPRALTFLKFAFVLCLVGLGAAHLYLVSTCSFQRSEHNRLAGELQVLRDQKKVLELAREQNIALNDNLTTIESLIEKKVMWSRKLNLLSDLIIDGVWYTNISIGTKTVKLASPGSAPKSKWSVEKPAATRKIIPYLIIEGEVSSDYGNQLATLGKFIQALKDDPLFSEDFATIQLDSTSLHSIRDIEVMSFNINCYFKESQGSNETG